MKPAEKIAPRMARPRDVAVLATLFEQEFSATAALWPAVEPTPGFDWPGRVKSLLSDPARLVLVAEARGQVAGYLHARVSATPHSKKRTGWRALSRWLNRPAPPAPDHRRAVGVIENCFVVADCRRAGIGRALVNAALDWFAGQQVRHITLGVLANNAAGVQFWQACGFSTYRFIMQRNI